jgi:hypothetical protein
MSTVRIQVRRGLASEWTSANPVLAAGEMGVETNTNKFKFGNGSSTWTALSYAAADTAAIGEISQDAIDQALSMGAGLTKTYNDGTNTITISVDSAVVATVAYVDAAVTGVNNSLTGYLETGDRGTANGVASLNSSAKILESELDLDGIALDIATTGSISGETISTPELVATDITSGGQIDANNVVISGNLTVSGTTTTLNTTNLSVTDPLIQVASDNSANTVDLAFVAKFNDGTNQHSGLVRDSSESKWKLFKGVTTSPTTNVDFTQGSLDDLAIAGLTASSASIGDVSNTELQYLNGVTSPIQTQINNVISDTASEISDIYTDFALKASPVLTDPTFTGTVNFPDSSINTADIAANAVTNAKIADSAINNAKIAGDAAIAQSKIAGLADSFAEKAPLDGPTFTGSVVLPSTTSIGNLSSTEIGYLDGITSSVQTQITAAGTALSNHESDTTNIHGIEDTSLLATKSYADTAEADAITAAGTAADSKIATAVAALTKSSVGLANVDNTSDADKPVSTATQTALDLKAPLAAPSFTGEANFESNVTIEGNLIVEGTTTTVNTSEVQINDPIFYLSANQYDTNTRDIGITGAYGTVGGDEEDHLHTGLVKDVTDGKWKLFSNAPHPVNNVVDFTSAAYDTLKVGSLEATTVTPSSGIVFSDGTQTKLGVPSVTTFATAISSSATLAAGEEDKFVPLTGAVTITLPASGYSTGQSIDFYQASGTGAQFASTNSVVGTPGLKFRTTNSVVTAMKTSSGWLVFGDLSA